jgi:hypothetical protein
MTHDRQIEPLLDAWFSDGPSVAPDRVIDDVAARIVRQPQRPAWRLQPWRFPTMSTPLKLVLIGAALVAALAAGAVFVGGGGRIMAPAPSPTPSPTPTPVPPSLPNGNLAPGTYTAHPLPGMTWTITVPAGWVGSDDWIVCYDLTPDVHSVCVGGPTDNEGIPMDSCAAAGTRPAASVDEFIAAVQAREDWTVSAPVDVTVSGYSGTRIDLEVPAGACENGSSYMVLAMPDGGGYRAYGPNTRFRLWILDIDGKPIVIFRNNSPASPAARVSEGDAIVDTGVIKP